MPRKYVDQKIIDEDLIKKLVDTSPDYTISGQSELLPTKEPRHTIRRTSSAICGNY